MVGKWNGSLTCIDSWAWRPEPENTVGIDQFVTNILIAGVAANVRMVMTDGTPRTTASLLAPYRRP